MIDYTIVTLQLSTLIALFTMAALIVTIVGTSIILWLLGKFVEACWWAVEQAQQFKKSVHVLQQ